MSIDYTYIFNAVIMLLAAVITGVAIPYLKERLGEIRYAKFLKYVEISVKAAEQIFSKEQTIEKKTYVYNYIKSLGFQFDGAAIDNAIEAAVLSVHNSLKEVAE